MLIIMLFVILAFLGFFMLKAARYGKLNSEETSIFSMISIGLVIFLIIILLRLS
jgi:uncharacterized membrane protein YidH (DUF202 family)